MSEIKVNKISPRTNCGTVTLGDSGDTITIPSGVTMTNNGTANGFGADGAVNWQTSIKTSTFTAANQEGYFVDTSSGAITANLPAGTAGNIVAFADYARNFGTHNLTISPNGSQKIGGTAASTKLDIDGQASTFVYADDTNGWINVQNAEDTEAGASFVAATGGTVTTVCTNFKVHTFTGPGTFCVSSAGNAAGSNTIDYLVVAGGGGGGDGAGSSSNAGGGGGAGGYRESSGTASGSYTVSPLGSGVSALPVTATGFPITIGAGGATNNPGSNTVFTGSTTITSAGGGEGGSGSGASITGCAGGSGGGANTNPGPGAAGNTPPVSPPQGNPGGSGLGCTSGGGGGATAAGGDAAPGSGGSGGAGATSSINGTPTTRATGGNGGGVPGPAGTPQPANSGNGGPRGGHPGAAGGTGGSGVVIIRYKFQ